VSQEDFEKINEVVNKLIAEKQQFERISIPKEVALEMFKVQLTLILN
jgi:threonyl-tRNA synthetase